MGDIGNVFAGIDTSGMRLLHPVYSPARRREKAFFRSKQLVKEKGSGTNFFMLYGRPAYIWPHAKTDFRFTALIFSVDVYSWVKKCYALDSGCVRAGFLANCKWDKADFFIGADPKSLLAATKVFFGDNVAYLTKKSNKDQGFDITSAERLIKWYADNVRLTSDRSTDSYDPPSHTFEIQTSFDNDLCQHLECVIAPTSYLDDADFRSLLSDLTARWKRKIALRDYGGENLNAENSTRDAIEEVALSYMMERLADD